MQVISIELLNSCSIIFEIKDFNEPYLHFMFVLLFTIMYIKIFAHS